jgi:hypothetical protein
MTNGMTAMTLTRSTLMNHLAHALPLALTLAGPPAVHAQTGPVTGTMMQTDGQQQADAAAVRQQSEAVAGRERALQEQAVQRQAAEQAARQRAQQPSQQPAPTPSAAPTVVRQLPNPAAPQATASAPPQPAAPAQAASASARPPAPVATAAPAAQAPVPQPAITGKPHVGDVSRSALAMQAEGRYAGPALPTLGATTRASWDRYVQSFRQPIPEFYPTNSSPKN